MLRDQGFEPRIKAIQASGYQAQPRSWTWWMTSRRGSQVQADWKRLKTARSNGSFGDSFDGALQEYVMTGVGSGP
ncbi:MAG TPA: hypothetical protein PLA44_06170 [Propionibacteriaceae bacterium]|nr:hypothetical protein [Propionibacteriaceae bacterium]